MSHVFVLSLLLYGVGVGVSQSLMSLGGTIFAVAAAVLFFLRFPQMPKLRAYSIGIFAWVLYSFGNHLVHGVGPYTSEALKNIPLFLVLCFPLLWPRPRDRDFAWIFAFYSLAVTVNIAFAAYQFYVLKYFGMGVFKNQIFLAYNLLPGFFFFAELALREKTIDFWRPLHSRIVAALIFFGIFTTNNRMTILLLLIYLFARALPWIKRRYGTKALGWSLAGILGFFAFLLYANPFVYDKISQTLMGFRDVSLKSRLFAWSTNWQIFLEHPLFGVGFSNNAIDSSKFSDFQRPWPAGHAIYAHSIYLQHLADSGLLGFLLLFIPLGILITLTPMSLPVVGGMLLAGLTENIFNNSKQFHAFLFFALLCLWLEQSQLLQVGAKRSEAKSS
jgi:O-antigen ligase